MQNRHQASADANFYFFKGYHLALGSNTKRIGGAERDRTADPLLAKQMLSQLSYSPNHLKHPSGKTLRDQRRTIHTTIRKSKWWARVDLNYRPHAYQACALTN
jgi:hypothetical protein